jgi:polysaccharide biosynthesis protein PslH
MVYLGRRAQKKTMSILYFAAHQAWPLTSGNRLRDYHLARGLAKHAPVTFMEMFHPGERPSNPPSDCGFEAIVSLKKGFGYTPCKVAWGIKGPIPLTVLNYFQTRNARQLSTLLIQRPFASVQIEGVHLSNYVSVIRATPNRPPIVVDWHNIESELMWRYSDNTSIWMKKMLARRTARLLQSTEISLLEGCDAHTVASERERQKLLAHCPSANICVVPNGVDTDFFSRTYISNLTTNAAAQPEQHILFVGSMDYHANIDAVSWFARSIWREISRKRPHLKFVIVGRNPPPAVRELASDRIIVTGSVEDVRPFYASAAAAIVPLRVGSGTRLKILEAMAAGVPVISTNLGAEGLEATHNVDLLLADSGHDIISAIDQILDSVEASARLVIAARDLVVRRYDWVVLAERLYHVHRTLMEQSLTAGRYP